MKKQDDVGVLKILRKKMDGVYYDQMQRFLRLDYFWNPWPNYNFFSQAIQKLPYSSRFFCSLFFLGEKVNAKEAETVLERNIVDRLVSIGLLRRDGNAVDTGGLSIMSFLGNYFVVDLPPCYPTNKRNPIIYMGLDSLFLANSLTIPKVSGILDLCTGSGIQAIVSSRNTSKTVGVELLDPAVKAATWNTILNDVEDRVEIRQGDLFDVVDGEKFDVVISNPPYMPVPPEIKYDIAGDGGPDGLRIINRILDGIDEHLFTGGKGIISGWGIGDEKHPLILDRLNGLSKEKKWHTTFVIHQLQPAFYFVNIAAEIAVRINEMTKEQIMSRWKKLFKETKTNTFYYFTIFIDKIDHYQLDIVDLSYLVRKLPEIDIPEQRTPIISRIKRRFQN